MTVPAIMPTASEKSALSRVLDLVRRRPEDLNLRTGSTEAELPPSLRELISVVAEILASGKGVRVVPVHRELTTREAAELLGVSRPTLIKLLDDGQISYTRPNSSRRIPLDEVMAYKERMRHERRSILNDMTADAVEMGLYDASSDMDGLK